VYRWSKGEKLISTSVAKVDMVAASKLVVNRSTMIKSRKSHLLFTNNFSKGTIAGMPLC
jgi:hypothetical protein